MPLKLNVGLSRKVGEPNYSSRGASVNLELELDSAIVGEPDRLQERISSGGKLIDPRSRMLVVRDERLGLTNLPCGQ